MHALIDQTGPLGIQKLPSLDGSKPVMKFVKRICVHKSLPTCHRVDARGALSCRDLVELDNLQNKSLAIGDPIRGRDFTSDHETQRLSLP